MGGIHHHHVDPGLDQRIDPLLGAGADTHSGTDPQTLLVVAACVGIVLRLLNVLGCDHAAQFEVVIHYQYLLDTVLVQQLHHLVAAGALFHGDQVLFAGHDVAHRVVHLAFEAQIPSGDDAHQLLAVDHRHTRDIVRAGQFHHITDADIGIDGDRLTNYAALVLLDSIDLTRLLLRRHVLVHDTDAALQRQRDGEARLGHCIHGGGNQWDTQLNPLCEFGSQVDVLRQHLRVGRDQQDIVECKGFLDNAHSICSGVGVKLAGHYRI